MFSSESWLVHLECRYEGEEGSVPGLGLEDQDDGDDGEGGEEEAEAGDEAGEADPDHD